MRQPRVFALELAVFAALACYSAAHWASGLVADAPDARVFACVVIAVAVATAFELASALPPAARIALRGCAALAGAGAGFVAAGLDRGLLAPGRWDELRDGVDRGFAALGAVQWPYDGPEPWAALTLMLAIPLVLTAAAVCAFWPDRSLRPFALVLLLALYGLPVTEHQFEGELARGIGLLLLLAAWLWLPRLGEHGLRAALVAGAAVVVACAAALPAAARYEEGEPLLDYESWNPFAAQGGTRFDWSHSYGPLDWPRDGTTLMYVESDERNYWKVQTLDRFDGFRWVRSGFGRGNSPLLPDPYREQWETSFRVTIGELDTNLFPIAGTSLEIRGADPVVVPSEDGTVEAVGESLEQGDSYRVEAYVPDPTAAQMRDVPRLPHDRYQAIPGEIVPYTYVLLPPPGTTALDGTGRAGDAARSQVQAPVPATAREILRSPYARVFRLARRLARGQPSAYDVVRSVQSHLRSEYSYSERPPSQEFPLAAFLFEDRIGYCQQFSGAMALMLRMLGIPARVAAGFTPGSYNADTDEYRVRDLDAHSWVEVWFTGVGWVPFDPTPAIAPAESQSSVDAASASGGLAGAAETPDPAGGSSTALSERGTDVGAASDEADRAIEGWMAIAIVVLLAGLSFGVWRLRGRLRRPRLAPADREVESLRRILVRTGEPVPARLTLRQLELRLEERAGSPGARYVRMLRLRRFAPRTGRRPDRAARRGLRRALAYDRGIRGRLAALAALPPVSFRRD